MMDADIKDIPYKNVGPPVVFIEHVEPLDHAVKFTKEGKIVEFDFSDFDRNETHGRIVARFSDTVSQSLEAVGETLTKDTPSAEVGKSVGEVMRKLYSDDNTCNFMKQMAKVQKVSTEKIIHSLDAYNKVSKEVLKGKDIQIAEGATFVSDTVETLGSLGFSSENADHLFKTPGKFSSSVMMRQQIIEGSGYKLNDSSSLLDSFSSVMKWNRDADVIESEALKVLKSDHKAYANYLKSKQEMEKAAQCWGRVYDKAVLAKFNKDSREFQDFSKSAVSLSKDIKAFEDTVQKQCQEEGVEFSPEAILKLKDHQSLSNRYFELTERIWDLGDKGAKLQSEFEFNKKLYNHSNTMQENTVANGIEDNHKLADRTEKTVHSISSNTTLFSDVNDTVQSADGFAYKTFSLVEKDGNDNHSTMNPSLASKLVEESNVSLFHQDGSINSAAFSNKEESLDFMKKVGSDCLSRGLANKDMNSVRMGRTIHAFYKRLSTPDYNKEAVVFTMNEFVKREPVLMSNVQSVYQSFKNEKTNTNQEKVEVDMSSLFAHRQERAKSMGRV